MEKKNSLYEEMKKFQGEKQYFIIALLILGVLGLIFPVIPGLLLIGVGIALISPKYGEALLGKIFMSFLPRCNKFRILKYYRKFDSD